MRIRQGFGGNGLQRGITLIEQIMCVAIIAILASVATPSLAKLLQRNELQTGQTELIGALQYARALAANSGQRTLICPTRDQRRCDDGTRWESGWLTGRDNDHDNQPDDAANAVGQGVRKLVIVSSSGRQHVHFQPDGTAGGSNITLTLCQPRKTEGALSVIVSLSGRIRGAAASSAQAVACAAESHG